MENLKEVVIVSGVRLPVGSFGGSLKDISAIDMGAMVVKEAVKRAGIEPSDVDETIVGQVGPVSYTHLAVPHLPMGILRVVSSYWAGFFTFMVSVSSVAMYPGAMALTLIPSAAHSFDNAFVSWATPPLLAL